MGQIGQILAASGQLVVGYGEQLLQGVTPDNYARYAGGIPSNHPAFIMGHLALYPVRVFEHLGADAEPHRPTSAEEKLFEPGVDCRDDPDGTIYPALDVLREQFLTRYRDVVQLLADAPDDALLSENPRPGAARERFPTAASMWGFYVGGHAMMHLGQWSAWRRAQGLGPCN